MVGWRQVAGCSAVDGREGSGGRWGLEAGRVAGQVVDGREGSTVRLMGGGDG